MTGRAAWIFPAFAMRHPEFRRDDIAGYSDIAEEMARRADGVVDINWQKFLAPDEFVLADGLEDTLQLQYACYIDSVALATFLQHSSFRCDYVAGYSMGVFAALCCGGVYSFEDGLMLMHQICAMAYRSIEPGEYGMGAVMGLTVDQVRPIMERVSPKLEISDVLGTRSLIISGKLGDVQTALNEFMAYGALNVKLIPVSLPFHSSRLAHMEPEVRELVGKMSLRNPVFRVVSSTTQNVLTTRDQVCEEIARNIGHPMNWMLTMGTMARLGVDQLLECGPSESLTNIAKRNLKGMFQLQNFRDYGRALASA
jgi:[acyl-carrier-protein] S-malonyltransferase